MNVLLSGASGFVGSAVLAACRQAGHAVRRLVRAPVAGDPNAVFWNPQSGQLDPAQLDGLDLVVHLAGENIAAGRWTEARKSRIYDSRVRGTQLLCGRLAQLPRPPRTLIAASAIGFYGDRGAAMLSEGSPAGVGFLADTCQAWEQATLAAADAGIRCVNLRIGVVLSASGGALAKMLPAFRACLGGPLGGGRQYLSWITLDDLVRAIEFIGQDARLSGPVNAVAPQPVTNREFAQTLGAVLHRPAAIATPGFVLRLLLGEMADALLLSSARVVPQKLLDSGFTFQHSGLRPALEQILVKPTPEPLSRLRKWGRG